MVFLNMVLSLSTVLSLSATQTSLSLDFIFLDHSLRTLPRRRHVLLSRNSAKRNNLGQNSRWSLPGRGRWLFDGPSWNPP